MHSNSIAKQDMGHVETASDDCHEGLASFRLQLAHPSPRLNERSHVEEHVHLDRLEVDHGCSIEQGALC